MIDPAKLLRLYPPGYRSHRGDEILTTLHEVAEDDGRLPAPEVLSVVRHGLRMRLGLAADQFGGRVLQTASLPGLMIGTALAASLLVYADWLPGPIDVVNASPMGFGPFQTAGPVLYLVWIAGAIVGLLKPRLLRLVGATCLLANLLTIVIVARDIRPNPSLLVLMGACVMPCVLAPPVDGRSAGSRTGALVAGGMTLGFLSALAFAMEPRIAPWPLFYFNLKPQLTTYLPYVAAGWLVCAGVLVARRRRVAAGAGSALLLPWLVFVVAENLMRPFWRMLAGDGPWIACLAMALLIFVALATVWFRDADGSRRRLALAD